MHLKSKEPFERAILLIVVVDFRCNFSVQLVDEVIALCNDGVFIPLSDIDLHRITLFREPLHSFRIDDDGLAVFRDDAPTALLVEHRVVLGDGMDVALIPADRPRPVFR